MLTDKIRLSGPETSEPEDFLASSLGVIFPDDITNHHGDCENAVLYLSERFGTVRLELANPRGARERRLFSHFVWNAGVELGGLVEGGSVGDLGLGKGENASERNEVGTRQRDRTGIEEEPSFGEDISWDVRGKRVLELGAGTGLAGIIAALSGASSVVLTDYPAEEVLENLKVNVAYNIDSRRRVAQRQSTNAGDILDEDKDSKDGEDMKSMEITHPTPSEPKENTETPQSITSNTTTNPTPTPAPEICPVTIEGHNWGDLTTPFAFSHAHSFDILLVADCLWMPWQHLPLLHSISHFLSLSLPLSSSSTPNSSSSGGRAWVIAGFHTGREKMRGFYEEENLKIAGLEIEAIWERDASGVERAWMWDRGREDATERKRWLVIGILRRRRKRQRGEEVGGAVGEEIEGAV